MIRHFRSRGLPSPALLALTVLAATACASAGKRLEQGGEAEARGDYVEAVTRYVDALEKDPGLAPARTALLAAWDSAVATGLREAARWTDQSDAVAAADAFRTLDRLRADAGGVGVVLANPPGFASRRRDAYDAAISALDGLGALQRDQRRWSEARSSYRRIHLYDPSPSQRQAAVESEAEALLDWSGDEALDENFRASYRLATEAVELSRQLPDELVDAATELQEQALSLGLHVLAVFPVETTSEVRSDAIPELEAQLTDVLDLEHWRRPPYFIAVADPASVRRATRRLSPPGAPLRPGRILDAVGADFGALLQITEIQVVEDDLKSRQVDGRTRDGRRATYHIEEGRARYTVTAEVTLFHGDGVRMDSFDTHANVSVRFRRGVYGGDPQNLDLSRGERRLFDPRDQQIQRGADMEKLVAELAADVAKGVFDRVLRRIP